MGMININKQMKKYCLIFGVVLFFCISIIQIFKPSYKFEYFYSLDKKNIVTRIEYESFFENVTYFTAGYFDENEIPESYVRPIYSGFTSGFELVFYWENNKCIFNYCYGDFKVDNSKSIFVFRRVSVDKLMNMKNDTTGNFHYEIERALF